MINDIYEELKDRYNKDQEFEVEVNKLVIFYGRKFMQLTKNEKQEKMVEGLISELVSVQFLHGYALMKNLLSTENITLSEEEWSISPGTMQIEIAILLNTLYKADNTTWYRNESTQKISLELINEFGDVYDLLNDIRREIATFGAYKAFLSDPRYKGKKNQVENTYLLGNPLDIYFINPQLYMVAQFLTKEQECWDLFKWNTDSTNEEGEWVGTIQFSEIPQDEESSHYLLNLLISNKVIQDERLGILNYCSSMIPDNILSLTQTRLLTVENMKIYMLKT